MNPRFTIRTLLLYTACWALALALYVSIAHQVDPKWSIFRWFATAGFLMGGFSGVGGRIFSLRGVLWGIPITIIVLTLFMFAFGFVLSRFSFSGETNLQGVSYRTYYRKIDTSRFDPIGAKKIYVYCEFRRDHYISFNKMSIGLQDYRRLLDAQKLSAAKKDPPSFFEEKPPKSTDVDQLLKVAEASERKPSWWVLPKRDALIIHTLRYKEDRRPPPSRIKKEIWLYDPNDEILWIFDEL